MVEAYKTRLKDKQQPKTAKKIVYQIPSFIFREELD